MTAMQIGTDGEVTSSALSPDGRTLYIAGDFTRVGPLTGSCVPVEAATGAVLSHPQINGVVDAQLSDGSGGWYVAHELMSESGSLVSAGVVHVTAAGAVDPQFSLALGIRPTAMALAGGKLLVSGQSTDTGGVQLVAAFDPTSGTLAWSEATNSTVFAMAAVGSTVFLGGDFTRVGSTDRTNLAALEASTGQVLPWAPALGNGGSSSRVFALAATGSVVFAGGEFQTVNGVARQSAAAIGTADGATLTWDAQLTALVVNTIAVDGSTVYLGGEITAASGIARPGVAAVNAVSGQVTAWAPAFSPSTDATVSAIAVDTDTVYLGGSFLLTGATLASTLVAVGKSDGVPRSWTNAGPRAAVTHITVDAGVVLLGGAFGVLGGEVRSHVAAIDVPSGSLTAWSPQLPQEVSLSSVAATGGSVYVAGGATSASGSGPFLAAIDASSGSVSGWSPVLDGWVQSMTTNSTTLYVGGSIQQVNGQARTGAAAFDLTSGQLLGWAPQTDSTVSHMLATDSTVYIAGNFTKAGGQSRRGLAAVDGSSGVAKPTWTADIVPGAGAAGGVSGMSLDGGLLYLVGNFVSVEGVARAGMAAVDAQSGALSQWGASFAEVLPRAVLAHNGAVYVAQQAGGGYPPAQAVALYDGTVGKPLSSSYVVEGHVDTMQMTSAGLFAAGSFPAVAGDVGSNLAIASS